MAKPTKILYASCLFTFGGIEQYVLNALDHMDYEKYEIDYLLPGNFTHANEAALIERGVRVIHCTTKSKQQLFEGAEKILLEGNYDIVHIMQGYLAIDETAMFYLAALKNRKRCGYKIILHAHGIADTTKVSVFRRLKRVVFRTLLRAIFNCADQKAACSPAAGAFLFRKHADVKMLYNGIDLQRFTGNHRHQEIEEWRSKYAISQDRLNIVTVGRFSEEKNPFFMLEILQALRNIAPNVLLTWVGEGELFDAVNSRAKEMGLEQHINFLGRQKQVEQILACCSAFILPSKREGAPLVTIEAQASAIGVYASDKVPDFIDCGGCVFIDYSAPASLWADIIYEGTTSGKIAARISEDNLRRFSSDITTRDLQKMYEQLIG